MTHSVVSLLSILSIFFSCSVCEKNDDVIPDNSDMLSNKLVIRIGANTFNATISDNPTATAFKALLPLTIEMNELNRNEKYAGLYRNVVANASNPGTIQNGDLMLYGSDTLVLFYQTFSTSYSYTKVGSIINPTGLAAALGSGDVTVTFELE